MAGRSVVRWLGLGLLGAGLVTALALAWRPRAVLVQVGQVVEGPMVVTVDQDGRTRVTDRFVVSAPLAGSVGRASLHAGDLVTQGDVVAQLVPLAAPLLDPRARSEAAARVAAAAATRQQAAAALTQARAALAFAEKEAARAAALAGAGALAQRDAEQAALSLQSRQEAVASATFAERVAAANVRLATAALERHDQNGLEQLPLRSPVDGVVLRVLQESEGVVPAGAPLLEIGDARALEVVVDVLTADAVDIRAGAPVQLERWGREGPLIGRVRRVEPAAFTKLSSLGVEEQRVNVLIDLLSPRAEWAMLGDAFRVEARITVWEGARIRQVPAGAVFRQGTGWAVYLVQDGRTVLRPVVIGRRSQTQVQVLQGLEVGDVVVVYPGDAVEPGVRVRAQAENGT